MTLRLKSRSTFLVLSLLLAVLIPVVDAEAQVSQSFSVSPTIFNVEAEPGQAWQTSLRLINTNAFPLEVSAQIREFIPGPDGGTPQFLVPEPSATNTFANWITTEQRVVVPAEQTIALPITVAVPANAEPGGHFAALLISTEAGSDGNTGVGTAQAISSLLFLRVAGEISEVATIRSFRTTDYIVAQPAATFDLRVENLGNVHVQPQGEIVIYNMWGRERGIIPINKQSLFGNVLPDSIRSFRFMWEGEWSLADIGRYRAEAALTYGVNGKKTIFSETTFWLIPWQWLTLVLIFIILFVLLLRWAIALYIKRMFALAGIPTQSTTVGESEEQKPEPDAKVSVMAPLEAGLLDLRSNIKTAQIDDGSVWDGFLAFVSQYQRFFILVLGIVFGLVAIGWFVSGAMTSERDFVITTEDGISTTAEEARALRRPQAAPTPEVGGDGQFLTLINRSGDPEAVARVRRLLEAANYQVTAVDTEEISAEERTIVVYPVTETIRALEISKLLNEAPVSALADNEARSSEIIVYIGSDALSW